MQVMVQVINDNKYPFVQDFKGNKIEIGAGRSIQMEQAEANEFLGLFSPVKKDANDLPDPKSFKMLRIVPLPKGVAVQKEEQPAKLELKCHACGYEATSKEDLGEHVKANHLDQLTDEEVAEELKNPKKGKTK